jgi:hypothetical protein
MTSDHKPSFSNWRTVSTYARSIQHSRSHLNVVHCSVYAQMIVVSTSSTKPRSTSPKAETVPNTSCSDGVVVLAGPTGSIELDYMRIGS